MKKIILPIVLSALVLFSATVFTMSYLSDNEGYVQKTTVGHGGVEVVEGYAPPSMQVKQEFVKDIAVRNAGSAEAFVRVHLDFSNSEIAEKAQAQGEGSAYEDFLTAFRQNPKNNWVFKDDYFYYKKPLLKGETTPSLTKKFKVDFGDAETMERIAGNGYEINVYAESVSTLDEHGNALTGVDAYKRAWNI